MATSLTFDEHGDGIGHAWMVIRDHANRVGPGAPVRTCPGWTVRDLVAHQGMVHRWATSIVRGTEVDTAAVEAAGAAAVDQLAWFDEGVKDLLQALVDAPDDLDVFFFLRDAPPPKLAWARRQCHETTVHAVDAMSASYGGPPPAADTWIRPALAVDGIDELLAGFLPRPRWQLHTEQPTTVSVEATDTGDSWTLALGPDAASTTRARADAPDVVLSGSAVQLYLGLWNRGDELVSSDPTFLTTWREHAHVTW